jgi:hypothetical protein
MARKPDQRREKGQSGSRFRIGQGGKMRLIVRLSACAVLLGLLAGCGTAKQYPAEGLTTVDKVFDVASPAAAAGAAPAESRKSSTFKASYADVFRAVVVATSQNQINIENEDRSRGYVTGTRAIQMVPPIRRCPNSESLNGRALPLRYFYIVVVRERAAKSTEVVAAVKTQGTCWTGNCFDSVDKEACGAYSKPHWATQQENPDESLTQLMVFIRNNLIAAGAL